MGGLDPAAGYAFGIAARLDIWLDDAAAAESDRDGFWASTGHAGATLTNHLNTLRRAGLIRDRRVSRNIWCRADYGQMNALISYLTENCAPAPIARLPALAAPHQLRQTWTRQ
jgi:hypothetical protein